MIATATTDTNPVKRHWLLNGVLLLAVMVSAIAVVYASHANRRLFNEWQGLVAESDRLGDEWGKLLLEQNALAAHARVERIAKQKMGMKAPALNDIILVRH